MLSKKYRNLVAAKKAFKTKLTSLPSDKVPVEQPPANLFRIVTYPSSGRNLPAYLTPNPNDGIKRPAIIWITGGDCNSIGDVWTPAPRNNDQTAAAYRQAGIVMMFPSMRGGNTNPGKKEGFLGETDDIVAAHNFLKKQNYVDPKRIYLGGHSTGGTLALLVAETTDRFRAVFSFGPVEDVSTYGVDSGFLPFDITDRKEVEIRSPIYWLSSIKSPVWVFEGGEGNADSLQALSKASKNSKVQFLLIEPATHFSVLEPMNRLIARKILQDTRSKCNISFTKTEVTRNHTQ